MVFLNFCLGLSTLALAAALGYALVLSRSIRLLLIVNLPSAVRQNLSLLFTALWFVVALLGVGGIGRIIYAAQGAQSVPGVAITSAVTALSFLACVHLVRACRALRGAA